MSKIYTPSVVQKRQIVLACIILAIAVVIGAFGAHGLKDKISTYSLGIYKTGVLYHFIHGMALLFVALISILLQKNLKVVFWIFFAGIICFSGSLYLLALREVLSISLSWVGPITPIGGILFTIGWLVLAYKMYRKN